MSADDAVSRRAGDRSALARDLVLQSMGLALALAALKAFAGWTTQSLGLLASALDSLMDFFSSGVNRVSLSFSEEPADEEHPYGHGKIEAVAGAVQGLVIAVSGLALLTEGLRRAVSGRELEPGLFALSVMAASMALSVVHSTRLRRAAARTGSPILRAEGLHFSMDVLSNLGVLLALVFVRLGASPAWDVMISLLVGGYVVKEAALLLSASVQELIDRRLSDEVHAELKTLILGHHPSIVGFHDLRTRRSGRRVFIDFHVEIAGVERFAEAHEITETLVDKIKARLPDADVTVHSDPQGAR